MRPTSLKIAGMTYAVRWVDHTLLSDAFSVDILKEEITFANLLSPETVWVLMWESVLDVLSKTQGVRLASRSIIYLSLGICNALKTGRRHLTAPDALTGKKTFRLNIGPFSYRVRFLKKDKFEKEVKKIYLARNDTPNIGGKSLYLGLTNGATCDILINTTDQARQVLLVTVWHELIHAILDQYDADNLSESKVDALAYMIVQALADNEVLRNVGCRVHKEERICPPA